MNLSRTIFCLLLMIAGHSALCQNGQMSVIEPLPLAITEHMTTNLIFPYAIKSVDKGSRDILAQKAKAVENILQLKAARANFSQTNLTVVTAEGKLYSFMLNYAAEPEPLNIEFDGESSKTQAFFQDGRNQAEIQQLSESISTQPCMLKRPYDKSEQAKIGLRGLYIHDQIIFYQLAMENKSPISYQIQSIRFFIRDTKRARRSAVQQIEIKPIHVHGDTTLIKGKSKHSFVFALPKFTLEDKKHLLIDVMEKDGGRHMQLKVTNSTITKAKPVS